MNILDLSQAPTEPAERLLYLSSVKTKALDELDAAFAETYYQLRLEHRFDWALSLGIHSRKKALAYTRHQNRITGRMLRWGDL